MLKQVLLVLSCCAIAAVRSQQPCLGAPAHLPHSFAAAPESCNAYILCLGTQIIRGQTCPVNMNFEPISQTCGQSTCTDCSPFGIQDLHHPDSCDQFIRCTMGTREFLTCPSSLMFDRTIGACNYPHLVQCPGQPIPTEYPTYPTNPTDDPYWPPTEPTQPWPPITTDNPWPPPTDPPGGGDRPDCVGNGQVFHAHPTDCNRFFMCVSDVLWEGNCPPDLHWNQLRNVCDTQANAGCLARPPGGPTNPPDFPTEPPQFPTDPPLLPPPELLDEQADEVKPLRDFVEKAILHHQNEEEAIKDD